MLKRVIFLVVFVSSITVISQTPVTICWDTSLSMNDRDIQKEMVFLNEYFKTNTTTETSVISFNTDVSEIKKFSIQDSNWNELRTMLESTNYDGATSYKELVGKIDGGDILLFTDGNQNYNDSNIRFNGNLFVINANKKSNTDGLTLLTNLNNGRFIDMIRLSEDNKGITTYSGKIYSENELDSNVSISIKGTKRSSTPSSDGTYQIEASPGEIIVVSQNGKKLIEKELGKNRYNNVWVDQQGIRLEEVVITGKTKNKELKEEVVNTGYGGQKKEGLGYGIQSIKDEDISEINTTVSDAVTGKFSGVSKGTNDDLSQSVIRGLTSIYGNNYPLIILDGVPLPRSNSSKGATLALQITDFIEPANIADITVLKGFAATNRYGSEGSGGVILITSKLAADLKSSKEKKNSALVKDNVYVGNSVYRKEVLVTPYLLELKKNKDTAEAYKIYLEQRQRYWNDPFYFTDVFDFFYGKDQDMAYRILSNIIEKDNSSIEELRGMMFKAINTNHPELVLRAADIILERFPGLTQSYFDIALANKNMGNYQVALNMLLGISDGSINPDLDFTGLKKCSDNEIRNLVAQHRGYLNTTNLPVKYNTRPGLDARLVFDWNNPDAEFEIQFVNPSKRFFKWLHTSSNPEEINDELKNGYSQEEFEIVGGQKGVWIINVKYLGNRTRGNNVPTYLKCSVQYNFGKPNQRNEEHLIRLHKKGNEQLFMKVHTK